jgi:hypothetical protein
MCLKSRDLCRSHFVAVKVADLPVQYPTKFAPVVNLKHKDARLGGAACVRQRDERITIHDVWPRWKATAAPSRLTWGRCAIWRRCLAPIIAEQGKCSPTVGEPAILVAARMLA